ncbi:MAG TPA: hypothetical protein VF128_10945 [Gemmatimonadaceae bacterium]
MNGRKVVLGLAPFLIAACGRGGEETPAAQDSVAAITQQAPLAADVQLAATIARAIDAAPASADSIISAHGLTRETLDSLMYVIAGDSAKTAAYIAARR